MKGGKPHGTNDASMSLRRLTVDEAALLQGFPPDYRFCGSQSKVFSQIGNAVPCRLAQVVAEVVYRILERSGVHQDAEYLTGQNMELKFAC
jgi:DNA (cytosine-5)-methyltransferase 1